MFITRKHLSRRTVLKGLGVAVSLPLLEAMVPALATVKDETALRPLRFGGVYVPNGVLPEVWHPAEVGANFTFRPAMKSLEPFREQLITINGLRGSGTPGPHLGCSCGWLNGVGAVGPDGSPILSGKTFDQYFVDHHAGGTPLPSLQVGTEDMGTSVGSCDGYSCLYFNSISWRTNSQPLPVQINPRLTFEAMYGATGTREQRLAALRYRQSILDVISEEARQFYTQVGPSDRRRIGDYLDNIREVEQRVQRLSQRTASSNARVPDVPAGIPSDFPEHVQLTYDLLHLAFQGDISRVFTFLTAVEASNQDYGWIGVPDSHHVCSHHGGIPELKDKYTRIVSWKTGQFARFVQKLKDTPDGDGSLLDHSLLLFGTGMGNGNVHDREHPAMVLVGGANGRLKGGRSILAKAGTWQCDVLLNLGELSGFELTKIGPSNGKLPELA